MTDWQPMETAPKDGRDIRLKIEWPRGVVAYWDDDLQEWVTSRPLHMECVHEPKGWADK
jgi:hypothetical protein